MAEPKTNPTTSDVSAFLESAPGEQRRSDSKAMRAVMERVTGATPTMWGPSMVGFGILPYTNTTGTHETFVVGFSPRKAALSVYGIFDEHGPVDPLFEDLGAHTTGKGCVYIKRLDDVDVDVLEVLIGQAWKRAESNE